MKKMANDCPICGSKLYKICGEYRGENNLFKSLLRAQCEICDLNFAMPMPNFDDLNSYNLSYFDHAHGGLSQGKNAKTFFNGVARIRLEIIEFYLNKFNTTVSQVLEIGPGPGYFANIWLKNKPDNKYFAIESDVSCHDILKKNGITILDLKQNKNFIESMDLIVMSHVLEHAPEPVRLLSKISNLLRPGGVIFIEVPCSDWEYKKIDEPHLLFFNKKALIYLLKKIGFIDIEINYYGESVEALKNRSLYSRFYKKIRDLFIFYNARINLFSTSKNARIKNSLELAIIASYKADTVSIEPSRWLRVSARKPK